MAIRCPLDKADLRDANFTEEVGREPGAHLAGESQFADFIKTDQQRIDAVRSWPVSAADEKTIDSRPDPF